MERNANIIKEWFINGKGCNIVRNLLPEQEEMISKYLNVPQKLNKKETSGVYYFYFTKDEVKHISYIGESGNIYFRLLEHLYNLFNNVTVWGVNPEDFLENRLKIEWSCELGIQNESVRKKIEKDKIEELKPFLQYTAPDSPEYGKDKKKYDAVLNDLVSRENIPSDHCVCVELRKQRANKLFYSNI